MSAQRRVTNGEAWRRWEGQVVKGIFPLRRFLGASDNGAVFLSEYEAGNVRDVAIKFVPAVASQAETQLAHWRTAATLSHPHLIRLFDMGRCQLGRREFLFVVMEYAEETLTQVLARRALSPDELREMLIPTLDVLAFLHRNQWVHTRLKPSNLLAVNDRLKLASDTVRPIADSGSGIVRSSSYDAPELKDGGVSTAGDIWSLGVTLVEALTQRTPAWSDERFETSSLLASIPAPFVNTVWRCLNPSPTNRPTVIELQTEYKSASQAHGRSNHQLREPSGDTTTPWSFPNRYRLLPFAVPAALLVSLAMWVGLHSSGNSQADLQPTAVPAPAPAATIEKPARPNSKPASSVSRTSRSVLREVSPEVPPALRDKIQGRILVTVRVLVDPSGNVMAALMENPGPSENLARLADNAAREWKFAPAEKQAPRVWILTFAFTRGGVTARATAV